jgi:hypothetical protein
LFFLYGLIANFTLQRGSKPLFGNRTSNEDATGLSDEMKEKKEKNIGNVLAPK